MKHFYYLLLLTVLSVVHWSACDTLPDSAQNNLSDGFFSQIFINPQQIVFDSVIDGQKDTTVTVSITVIAEDLQYHEIPMLYVFANDSEDPWVVAEFEQDDDDMYKYHTDLKLRTQTFVFAKYTLLITTDVIENNPPNFIVGTLVQTGVSLNRPQILQTNGAISVSIPTDNTPVPVLFTAKVVDEDGQDNIRNVFLNFREPDGSLLSPQPYAMMDDGKIMISGDGVAGDSVYSKIFQIDRNNTPKNRMALYWAVDKAGLSSDTLQVPFNITN